MALQGQNGNWEDAAEYFAATEGRLDTCKGRAAHKVLGDLLRFHQQHPSFTTQLTSSKVGGGADVCDFRITRVTGGEKGEVTAGEPITIEVSGAHFSAEDLGSMALRVSIGGKPPTGGLELVTGSQSGDRFSFTAGTPLLSPLPQTVDVTISYDAPVTLADAITIVAPDTGSPDTTSPVTSPSP